MKNTFQLIGIYILVFFGVIGFSIVVVELIDKPKNKESKDIWVGKVHYIKIGDKVINYTEDSLALTPDEDSLNFDPIINHSHIPNK